MTDREALTYEQARDELASVVKRLETGGLTLEQSLDLWERGDQPGDGTGEGVLGRGGVPDDQRRPVRAGRGAVVPEPAEGPASDGAPF